MKILVLVKHVPDATGDRGFTADHTVDREVAEKADDAEVVVLTVGPDDAADAIKRALQMGASAGIHVLDDAIAGSDALATSEILAAAIRKAEPDLVVCGMASTDGAMGVVPVMVAERLGWPAATLGVGLEVGEGVVSVRRDTDTASLTVEATLPAVVSVTDQSGEARYPSMKGILAAKKKPVDEWSLADLGIEEGSVGLDAAWSTVSETTPRPPKEAGKQVADDDGAGSAAFVEFLAAGKFI
jgi:electron transfer flavoprotein beta subunit